jgi:hypothetical protein
LCCSLLNTVENRRKYVQFIAQEVNRFNLIPFSREACEEIIDEGRRRSNKRDALSTKFRPLISILKTAGTLAMNEGAELVEAKHVKEAIENHCKTIQRQILEHQLNEKRQREGQRPAGGYHAEVAAIAARPTRLPEPQRENVGAVKAGNPFVPFGVVRRTFLIQLLLGSALAAQSLYVKDGQRILFLGDSITQDGRYVEDIGSGNLAEIGNFVNKGHLGG